MGACKEIRRKNELFNWHKLIPLNIASKVLKSICKIIIKKEKGIIYGFGFFMLISDSEKYLITNYNIISQDVINENIEIEIYNNNKMKLILKDRDIKYFPKPIDITIIEMKNDDEIYNDIEFLYYDMNYINGYDIYKDVHIYSIGHPDGENASYERGQITNIKESEFNFNIPIDKCSMGCPIILLDNNINLIQVVGIHKEVETDFSMNLSCGTFIGEIFKNGDTNINNFIIAEIDIGDDDVDKNIRIINSYEEYKRKKNSKEKIKEEKMNEEEIKKCQIEINNEPISFKYHYRFPESGKYVIKYSFKIFFTKINNMFTKCHHLTNIDLSNFNTKNVTNMSSLFRDCKSLKNIDISFLDTHNVKNMSHMFYGCESLSDLNLSNFDTKNVINMNHMFENCKSLINLDLSNFNTQNVINMENMFVNCTSLSSLNLSDNNEINGNKINDIFKKCKELEKAENNN